MTKPKYTKPQKPRVKSEKMKDIIGRETGDYYRSLEEIPILTPYYIGKSKRYVSDKPQSVTRAVLTMRTAITRAADQLQLAKQQRDRAMYLFNKILQQGGSARDYTLDARALLYIAGQEMGFMQRLDRFAPKGKERMWFKRVKDLGGKRSVQPSALSIMARANELLVEKGLPPLTQDQVREAIATKEVVKNLVAWVIVYDLAKRGEKRWNNSKFGMTQVEFATMAGASIQGVRNLFNRALVVLGKASRWGSGGSKTIVNTEVMFSTNRTLKRLGLHELDMPQVQQALDMMPDVARPDAWVIIYHFALGTFSAPKLPSGVTSTHGSKFFQWLSIELGVSKMTVGNQYNWAKARLGKAARWKSFSP